MAVGHISENGRPHGCLNTEGNADWTVAETIANVRGEMAESNRRMGLGHIVHRRHSIALVFNACYAYRCGHVRGYFAGNG
jgi:hypothetical protein